MAVGASGTAGGRVEDPVVRDIEDAFVEHWSHMGRWSKGRLLDDGGALRFETPIARLPYNAVIRSHLGDDADDTIARVIASARSRGVDCMWIVHPSAQPEDLGRRLLAGGLSPVEEAAGMSLDLAEWQPEPKSPGVRFERVVDDAGLATYVDLNLRYWELDAEAGVMVDDLIRYWLGKAPVERWLAFLDDRPVGKGVLSRAAPPGVAAIYGMSVLPEARRRGIAGGLTSTPLACAREQGCERVVLHASGAGAGVYRRAGFVERCRFVVYATAPLWTAKDD